MKDRKIVSQGESLSFGAIRSKAGKYWCSVSNGLGVAVNASAHLDVQCEYCNFILEKWTDSLSTKPEQKATDKYIVILSWMPLRHTSQE